MYCQAARRWPELICLSSCNSINKGRNLSPHASLPGVFILQLGECVENRSQVCRVLSRCDSRRYSISTGFSLGTIWNTLSKATQLDFIEMFEVEMDGEVIKRPDKPYHP